jgi:hypothetical protein
MSHFDDIFPAIRDGLAVFGFMTLCTIFCFLFFVAKDAWHDRREQDKAQHTDAEKAIKEAEVILGFKEK